MFRTGLAAALIALPLWVATTTPASACSCGNLADYASEFDLIVVGTVSNVRVLGDLPSAAAPGPGAQVPSPVDIGWDFDVEEYIKGSGGSKIELQSRGHASVAEDGSVNIQGGLGADCSFAPEEGARYLFGVESSDGKHFAGGCSGLTFTPDGESYVNDVIAEIRAALQGPDGFPDVGTGPPDGGSSRLPFLVATIVIAGLGLLSLGVAATLRRSS